MSKTKVKQVKAIPHIDARTVDEIAMDNKHLMEKLKYNHQCMMLRKNELNEEKFKARLLKIAEKPRKTYAWRVNTDQITIEMHNEILDVLNKLFQSYKTQIAKSFILNNFIYIKVKHNIKLPLDNLSLNTGHILEQINPKDIINMQLK